MNLTIPSTRARLESLHATLCQIAPEAKCVLNMYREHEWWEWLKWRPDQPFTEADLRTVVAYRRRLIAARSQFPACLRFGYLIGRPDMFEEDLAMAQARTHSKPTDREQVLQASGRAPKPETRHKLCGPLAMQALNRLREATEE